MSNKKSKEEAQYEKYREALKKIRNTCRDGHLLEFVKLLEIYEATAVLDSRDTFLNDMRTGKKE
jgi:hypothetical protein